MGEETYVFRSFQLVDKQNLFSFLNMSYLLGNEHYGRVWNIAHRSFLGQDLGNQRAALEVGGASSHCLIALARFQKVQRAFHNPTFMGNC